MKALTVALLALTVSCAVPHVPVPPPVPPVPIAHNERIMTVRGATGTLTPDFGSGYTATADATGLLTFVIAPTSTGGAWLSVTLDGYQPYQSRYTFCLQACDQPDVQLVPVPAFPPVPTRAQVTNVKLTFQGLTVCTHQYGCLPWFEPAIEALTDPADRQVVYAAKHTQGDTHLIIGFHKATMIYGEPPHYQNIGPTPDWEANQPAFLALVEEIIQNGFIPIIDYDGDAGDQAAHGYSNAVRQAPILAALLQTSRYGDLNAYVLYFRGWDSVFYGSTPANIQAFGRLFRTLLPGGYLAIEFNTGHIPLGNGPGDYAPGGMMTDYDVIMGEFDNWPAVGGAEWQVLARMLGPAYVPDPGQPGDSAPFYLRTGSPRGPYVFTCFEFAEYGWTHDQVTAAQILQAREWYKRRGCTSIG